jgi:Rha family phage regulatory protein
MTVATIETNTKAATLNGKPAKSIKKPKAELSLTINGAGNNITIDSLNLAKCLEWEHKNLLPKIDKLIEEGTISRLEFQPRNYTKRGKIYPAYELTETGVMLVLQFVSGEKPKAFKKRLVYEFQRLRKLIYQQSLQRETQAYQLARISGKDTRALLVEVIQQFIDYAAQQGSQNAGNYYSNITSAVNRALFEAGQDITPLRDQLNAVELKRLELAETIAAQVISDGMTKQLPYKAIYQAVKAAIQPFSANKTKVLGVNDG